MPFRIRITKVERQRVPDEERNHPWVQGGGKDGGYGYADFPADVQYENVETEILSQTVETLDIAAVIKAVNAL